MAGVVEIPATSNEFLRVQVSAVLDGVPRDITTDTVDFAFEPITNAADPLIGDWHPGTMEKATNTYAKILIGSDGVSLAIGRYRVWVRVTDSPEIPVHYVGVLSIT